jgi:predicted TIM-barrel fold metal-dependent hydrolase
MRIHRSGANIHLAAAILKVDPFAFRNVPDRNTNWHSEFYDWRTGVYVAESYLVPHFYGPKQFDGSIPACAQNFYCFTVGVVEQCGHIISLINLEAPLHPQIIHRRLRHRAKSHRILRIETRNNLELSARTVLTLYRHFGRFSRDSLETTMKIVDTHQHLWDKDLFHYSWLEPLPNLDRSFRITDYRDATHGLEIDKSVFVECDVDESQVMDEALHVLALANDAGNRIAGIVASGRPEKEGFKAHLDNLAAHPKVKGVRRILHTHPDELGKGKTFIDNVRSLAGYNLSFDICVLARQIPVAINLVKSCPETQFILDHCGVPEIKDQKLEPWREHIGEISGFPNVACKISGIVAYADPVNWKAEDLQPFVDHVIECFGWDRVMFGSDWPVCNLTANYTRWVETLRSLTSSAGEANQRRLFSDNALRIYRLS